MWRSIVRNVIISTSNQINTNQLPRHLSDDAHRQKKFDKNKTYLAQSNKNNKGFRRNVKTHQERFDKQDVGDEDIEEEVDAFKADKLYDQHKKDRAEMKEFIKLKMVGNKYFKNETAEKETQLTWEEREHIRFLHNTEPETWTYDMIAEHFNISPVIAKKVASSKWIPKAKKMANSFEENLPTDLTSYSISHPNETNATHHFSNNEKDKPVRSKDGKKLMTWQDLQKSMGNSNKNVTLVKSQPAPELGPGDYEEEENPDNRLYKGEKWANNSEIPKLKVDQEKGVNNVYFYDSKHGYQHPFGKNESSDQKKDEPMLKINEDLYQKGDSFFSEDGEFLYRVPGLLK